MMKPHIQELIVVEGKDDVSAIKRAVDADILTTNGMGLTKSRLEEIVQLAQKRGVIIFTDPDFPGGKIRQILSEHIPECKHAFLPKRLAHHAKSGKPGIEYAKPEDILEALRNAKAMHAPISPIYTLHDLIQLGLCGPNSAARRQAVCEHFHIGQANAKQLLLRLNHYQIPPQTLAAFLDHYEENPSC